MKNKYNNLTTRLILSLAILMILSFSAAAQSGAVLTGKLTSENGAALSDAAVVLVTTSGQRIAATTNENGDFRFENVPAGDYILQTVGEQTAGGEFLTVARRVTLIGGQTQNLDIEAGANVRAEVVVTASGTAQTIDEVSKSVNVISNQELNNRNEITVLDSLRTIPGLRVRQSGGFGRIGSIRIRGLRDQDTAVLIDGQRFRDAASPQSDATAFLSDLQVTGVERIEVLRGSGSSLYGTNAIGGVFNVQTDNFERDFRGSLLAEGGGLGQFRGRANFGGSFNEKSFYTLGLSHTDFTKGVDGDDDARNTSLKAATRFSLNNYANLTGRFYFSDAFVKLNNSPDVIGNVPLTGIIEARPLSREQLRRYENNQLITNVGDATFIPDQNDPDNNQASRFYNFNVALDGVINRFANYRVSYQNLTTERRIANGLGGIAAQQFGVNRNDYDGNIQTLQAKSDVIVKSNTVTFGYEFEREKFGNDNFAVTFVNPTDTTDAVQTSNTVFVQDQIEAFDRRLQLSGAVRGQFFDLKNPRFSFISTSPFQDVDTQNPPTAYTADGSAAYFFRATNTKLRAHVGNGYRVPSLFERFSGFSFFGETGFYGDPTLKPERAVAFDAGIDQTFQKNRIRLSAAYFYTKLFNTINFGSITQPDRFNRSLGYSNLAGGIARGGEFSAEFAPLRSTTVFTSYTFTKAQQRQAQNGVLQTFVTPTHQFTAVVTQRLFNRLSLNFDFVAASSYLSPVFQSSNFSTRVYRFDGNRKGDLTASYEIPTNSDKLKVKLFGTIENIFNQDYYESGFRTARAQGRGGLAVSF